MIKLLFYIAVLVGVFTYLVWPVERPMTVNKSCICGGGAPG